MHELSITEHLLDYCLKEAQRQGAVKIRAIKICVGQLGGIVPECIQVYLDMLSEGTIAEGARIEAEFLPVRVRCRDCGREGEITPRSLQCPHCGSLRLELLSGKEFYIESMEVDTDGDKGTAPDHGLERGCEPGSTGDTGRA
ncbi:hydrogenase maturation nickel metallochaperone HypA [Lachnoclostridium sp. An169]|uniref:hydrogenase maturation nickel metallochaperone HypA n=1 Tax=Lachnoclostridium sp. An169 TaxID=1965569 RepID=UPI000B3990AA|nr:hydrogenase maturation nickel metallochaperone HypA [Lachnoclostridium sp. An169]OUP81337.1 hydrogenase maturation nickel metallochaperone HypA [Lachnoclostridium sp. An169]HJA66196.1 hydrogenase maturation nickel metallochaperone HypA [Candidatus Mediterraneibacter cottocaccae]